jgi:hypothetical protein
MSRARSVLLILFLLAGSLSPPVLGAQGSSPPARQAPIDGAPPPLVTLEQNYPNPVSDQTWIPFTLDAALFEQDSTVNATIRIYNLLAQPIAIPVAMDHPRGRGTRVIDLDYSEPGLKTAYWDGKNLSGQPVPTGVYYVQIIVSRPSQPEPIDGWSKLTVLTRRGARLLPW